MVNPEAGPLAPLSAYSTPSERTERYTLLLKRLKLVLEGMDYLGLRSLRRCRRPRPAAASTDQTSLHRLLPSTAGELNFTAAMATVACEIHHSFAYSSWTVGIWPSAARQRRLPFDAKLTSSSHP